MQIAIEDKKRYSIPTGSHYWQPASAASCHRCLHPLCSTLPAVSEVADGHGPCLQRHSQDTKTLEQ
ncbi:hypothetical protein E2C01_090666 [Portunus trituberculatus]|uniref:Uncharacterized protein n=1 Tax=Portunus trituberculatus TaxID=210409 RepID=A0A5B7JT11_PORTR|nr:hypothetical protein [Portunus trituberculatus]